MIDAKLREKILKGMRAVLDAFDRDMADINMISRIPISHRILLTKMYGLDLDGLNDIQLAMLCGMIEMTFVAGDYGYSKEKNLAINNLGDLIFDLSH